MVLPLSGVKVVELTRDVSGSFCGMTLADTGADVLKVERPAAESSRDGGPLWRAAQFVAYNRNKKSIAIDLESTDGKAVLSKLLRTADVFLEDFPPGAVDGLGFSYERVSKLNPRIVYCSIKSYLPGPYGDMDVEDTVVESQAGYIACMGEEKPEAPLTIDSPPLKLGVAVTSLGAGEFAAMWIAGSLLGRMRTGKGEHVRVGKFESIVNLNAPSTYSLGKEKTKLAAINYKLKDGEWIHGRYIKRSDERWKDFCDTFGVSREDYERSKTRELMDALGPEMDKIIAKYVANFTLAEARQKIIEKNILAGAVVTMKELIDDDQIKPKLIPLSVDAEVGMTAEPKTVAHMMLPIQNKDYNPEAAKHWTPAPKLGQHTNETLHELGYTEEQITDLQKRKIVYP